MSRHGMVATSQPLAAATGIEILRNGGNAVDAAVAMAAMLNVIEPMSTGVGGDAFAVIYEAKTGRLRGLNASGRSPYAATLPNYQKRLGGSAKDIPANSFLAVTVPGTVDGWSSALATCGRMSLAEVLAPAIRTAEDGFAVAPQTSITWKEWQGALTPCPDSVKTWLNLPNGSPRPGEVFRCPSLAATLRLIAEGGSDAFYKGPLADTIVRFSDENAGLLSHDDFADHASTWVEPVSVNYRGYQIVEMPPNGQGISVLETLQILADDNLADSGHNTPDTIHLQLEAMKRALYDSKQFVTDPGFTDIPLDRLISIEYAKEQRRHISNERVMASSMKNSARIGDTVYLCTADNEGNVVSFINSIFFPWGTGITVGDTGIVLQNRGSSFSLDPNHANTIAPHKRTRHTILPAMVLKENKPLISFGFVGGDVQPQGQVQFLCNVFDFRMNVQDALDAPRWRYDDVVGHVGLEASIPGETWQDLKRRGHEIAGSGGFFGGGQAILIHPEYRTFQGGSDSRRDGCAIGY
ncbi:MAG: gamma-glutamyltransferase [Pyrinomonadaceae bacterium]